MSTETRLEELQASLDVVIGLIESTRQSVIQTWTLPAAVKLSRCNKVKCFLPDGDIIVVKVIGDEYEACNLKNGDIALCARVNSYECLDAWIYSWTLRHITTQHKIWLPI